jgi:hypothetical protein
MIHYLFIVVGYKDMTQIYICSVVVVLTPVGGKIRNENDGSRPGRGGKKKLSLKREWKIYFQNCKAVKRF